MYVGNPAAFSAVCVSSASVRPALVPLGIRIMASKFFSACDNSVSWFFTFLSVPAVHVTVGAYPFADRIRIAPSMPSVMYMCLLVGWLVGSSQMSPSCLPKDMTLRPWLVLAGEPSLFIHTVDMPDGWFSGCVRKLPMRQPAALGKLYLVIHFELFGMDDAGT